MDKIMPFSNLTLNTHTSDDSLNNVTDDAVTTRDDYYAKWVWDVEDQSYRPPPHGTDTLKQARDDLQVLTPEVVQVGFKVPNLSPADGEKVPMHDLPQEGIAFIPVQSQTGLKLVPTKFGIHPTNKKTDEGEHNRAGVDPSNYQLQLGRSGLMNALMRIGELHPKTYLATVEPHNKSDGTGMKIGLEESSSAIHPQGKRSNEKTNIEIHQGNLASEPVSQIESDEEGIFLFDPPHPGEFLAYKEDYKMYDVPLVSLHGASWFRTPLNVCSDTALAAVNSSARGTH